MGYAVATAAVAAGATVTLVSGPVALTPPTGININRSNLPRRCWRQLRGIEDCDVFIGVAAVANRPAQTAASKIKKDAESVMLELIRNPDILARSHRAQSARSRSALPRRPIRPFPMRAIN